MAVKCCQNTETRCRRLQYLRHRHAAQRAARARNANAEAVQCVRQRRRGGLSCAGGLLLIRLFLYTTSGEMHD